MKQSEKFDVVIIGAGPAGSTAALRLMAIGYKTALVESCQFPRNQIGESLSPGVWNIFQYLDAEHLLDKSAHLFGLGSSVVWETKVPNENQASPTRIMVDRSKLDADLVSLSVERGLHLFQPSVFESCQKKCSTWEIRIRHENTERILLAKCIVDARGRMSTTAKNRLVTAPPTYALWAHMPLGSVPYQTLIEAVEEGWLWGSPTSGKQFRIMAFIDPEQLKLSRPEIIFKRLLSRASLFKEAVKKDNFSVINTCSVLNYVHRNPFENGYIRIGEAAFSLDPLSSTGVEKAMRNSLQAVIALNTWLKTGDEQIAKSFYENRIIESILTHTVWTSNYYANAWPGRRHSFWKDRSEIMIEACKNPSAFHEKLQVKKKNAEKYHQEEQSVGTDALWDLSVIWYKNVYISSEVTYIKTACVVGDIITLKTSVKHPSIDREIAFLEQQEIVNLFRISEMPQSFGSLVYYWSHFMPFKQSVKIIRYLLGLKILCMSDD